MMELTTELFIRLSWNIYFQRNAHLHNINSYYSDLNNLVANTKLNPHILSHSLYYLYLLVKHKSNLYQSSTVQYSSFQSSSREKLLSGCSRKNTKELFELMVVLMMISNKSNDDSSYTMKTWENLTTLTIPVLKKREITILKKINYNVFLKDDSYAKWSTQLYNLAAKYGLINRDSQLQLQLQSQPQQFIPELEHHTQEQPLELFMNYPLTPKSPIIDLSANTVHSNKRSNDYDDFSAVIQTYKKPKLTPFNELQSQLLTPLKFDNSYYPINDLGFIHHKNCNCCYLTNSTNIYHSALMKSLVKL